MAGASLWAIFMRQNATRLCDRAIAAKIKKKERRVEKEGEGEGEGKGGEGRGKKEGRAHGRACESARKQRRQSLTGAIFFSKKKRVAVTGAMLKTEAN